MVEEEAAENSMRPPIPGPLAFPVFFGLVEPEQEKALLVAKYSSATA